ncbi:MAG: DinB family protein [Vampirovibrionales bacterium]|nr:DinB family protein [Vampirovibrionales bacterium]
MLKQQTTKQEAFPEVASRLEAPGQGLPFLEGLIARYILFPIVTRRLSRLAAIQTLYQTGQEALSLAKALPPEQLVQRQLIPRFAGIEDSSRYWSVLMTIQHLWITGEAMAQMIEKLVQGERVTTVVRIEDVKPNQDESVETIFSRYERFLFAYCNRMERLLEGDFTSQRHPHPWFGAINAHQWLCLNALHHQIHLKQIKKIISHLS